MFVEMRLYPGMKGEVLLENWEYIVLDCSGAYTTERRACEEWVAMSGVVEKMQYNVRISLTSPHIEPSNFYLDRLMHGSAV